jgi:hypothetical protein
VSPPAKPGDYLINLASWGAVRRELLRQLKLANGTPLCTVQIAHLVNNTLALNLSQDDLARLRVHVRYALKSLCSRNAVVRFSAATQPGDFSTWLLADSPA